MEKSAGRNDGEEAEEILSPTSTLQCSFLLCSLHARSAVLPKITGAWKSSFHPNVLSYHITPLLTRKAIFVANALF